MISTAIFCASFMLFAALGTHGILTRTPARTPSRTLCEHPARYPHSATLLGYIFYCAMELPMNLDSRNLSHLFTIRLWFEPTDCEGKEVRLRVHHVLSGEVRYFRRWITAIEFIAERSIEQDHQRLKIQYSQTEESKT